MGDQRKIQTVIFLHVPKAAGTTLVAILRNQYGRDRVFTICNETPKESVEEYLRLPMEEKEKLRVIEGHWPVELHRYAPQPCTYVTLLRNPVERVVSHYYHIRRTPSHYAYDLGFSKDMTLAEYVGSSSFRQETQNGQVWFLSGGLSESTAYSSEEILETAKSNLLAHFSSVGITDMFDESLILFRRKLDWRLPFYYRHHVAPNRPALNSISRETIEVIANCNKADTELYRFAKSMLEETIREAGLSFALELRFFRFMNKWYQRFIETRSWVADVTRPFRRVSDLTDD